MSRIFYFLAGFFVSYLITAASMLVMIDWRIIVDRDGGKTMGVIFVLAPLIGLVGGTIGLLVHRARVKNAAPE